MRNIFDCSQQRVWRKPLRAGLAIIKLYLSIARPLGRFDLSASAKPQTLYAIFPMQQTLFNKKKENRKKQSSEELSLTRYDKRSMSERVQRLKFLKKIFPKGFFFGSDLETAYIFNEVKMAFINGEFISTILLSQAFIERRLQMHYISLGLDNIANKGLKTILDHAKKNSTIHHFLLPKIDELRLKRNPFVHLKDHGHKFNISQRIYNAKDKVLRQPMELISEDATEALRLMYAIFITPLK